MDVVIAIPVKYNLREWNSVNTLWNYKKYVTAIFIVTFRCIFFAFILPEIFGFLRSLKVCLVKTVHRPKLLDFMVVLTMETLHVSGVAILFYCALPYMDSVRAVMSAR